MTNTGPLTSIPSAAIAPLADDEGPPSALDLRPDGRIVVSFSEDVTITLRRPTLGEFRRWRTLLTEIQDEAIRLATKQKAEAEADAADAELSDEDKTARRLARATEQDTAGEMAAELWWSDVFKSLGDREIPEADDWPPFLVYGNNVLPTVLAHWRDVPLAPGRRSNQIK